MFPIPYIYCFPSTKHVEYQSDMLSKTDNAKSKKSIFYTDEARK